MSMQVKGNAPARFGLRVLVLVAAACLVCAALLPAACGRPNSKEFSPAVALDGAELRLALSGAVAGEYMKDFKLQEYWSSCGAASVRNVLASAGRHLEKEGDLFVGNRLGQARMLLMGMPLERAAALLNGQDIGDVAVLRNIDSKTFLEHLERSNDSGWRYIVNFDRKPLFGVSIGHFSPLGGYQAASGNVLLLDVTPGYGFSLVPAPLLFAAMNTPDDETGLRRGMIALKVNRNQREETP